MIKRLAQFSRGHARLVRGVGYGWLVLAVAALLVGGYWAYQQYRERQALLAIVQTFQTGDPAHDIKAAVDYVYDHAYIGDGKFGVLRASATQVLDPSIGGQCGEFVRLTVNLLDVMGYQTHRLYMFPIAEAGKAFDPAEQPSFHVAAEVWVDGQWMLVDPLHGITFHDQSGQLVSIQQVVADPKIIKAGYVERPQEVHPATYGGIATDDYWISPKTFSNPQGLNWGQRPFSWLYKALGRLGVRHLNQIYLPVLAEQPYAMLAIFWLGVAMACGLVGAGCLYWHRKAATVNNPVPAVLDPAAQTLQAA